MVYLDILKGPQSVYYGCGKYFEYFVKIFQEQISSSAHSVVAYLKLLSHTSQLYKYLHVLRTIFYSGISHKVIKITVDIFLEDSIVVFR